jgi:hypothetical protein
MRLRAAAVVIGMVLAASAAGAQPPTQSLEGAGRALQRGDRIEVVDHRGDIVEGRFESLSASSLRVMHKGVAHDLPAPEIRRIRHARDEPDGVLIGLGAGAAAGLGVVTAKCSGSSERADCHRVGSLIVIAPFAVVGALIDRAVTRLETIFDRPEPSAIRVRISPVLTARDRGVALTFLSR